MEKVSIDIVKTSGEKVHFSTDKLRSSLVQSGADDQLVEQIVGQVKEELYDGITSREIYNRAFALLKNKKSIYAAKYKVKRAIFELGPTGFPFEKFVAAILDYSGFKTTVGKIMRGVCVTHEIDVFAEKNDNIYLLECKFHGEEDRNCNVKVPLYINSRFQDVKQQLIKDGEMDKERVIGGVVTNTRFTDDALKYGICMGLHLFSWDYPEDDGLKDRIYRLGLYPITVSQLLTKREKQFLLSRDVVLCRQLIEDQFFLDHLGVSATRKQKILKEINQLCGHGKR